MATRELHFYEMFSYVSPLKPLHMSNLGDALVLVNVTWDGPNDPENPKNWPASRKWMVFIPMSLFNLLSSMSSATVAPALEAIADDLKIRSQTLLIMSLSVYLLGSAIVPLVSSPLSEMYGRVIILSASNIVYIIFNTLCGIAKTQN
ncbi:hypothetical protein KXV78_000279 [Aspergillus fumigatus]|nr:hypothetical protein KXV78_000279 [Aspergillus fumigatus]